MPVVHLLKLFVAAGLLLGSVGCSSLGLTCFSSQSTLTDQAEAVLRASPRRPDIPRELDQTVLRTHYLQPGDVLLIEPVELDSDIRLPADQRVLVDGTIDLGAYGRLIVAGLTIEKSEELIEASIVEAGDDPTQVNVRLLEPVHRYYVLGEVSSPGSYPLDGHESVLDGILAAGGLTSGASPCKILLTRPTPPGSCRVTLPICYREITQLGDTTTNYQLQSGDRIFVASRSLCEELCFWKANETCERCGNCQYPCPNPEVIEPHNPVMRIRPQPASGAAETTESLAPRELAPGEPTPAQPLLEPGLNLDDLETGELELPGPAADPPAVQTKPAIDGELDF